MGPSLSLPQPSRRPRDDMPSLERRHQSSPGTRTRRSFCKAGLPALHQGCIPGPGRGLTTQTFHRAVLRPSQAREQGLAGPAPRRQKQGLPDSVGSLGPLLAATPHPSPTILGRDRRWPQLLGSTGPGRPGPAAGAHPRSSGPTPNTLTTEAQTKAPGCGRQHETRCSLLRPASASSHPARHPAGHWPPPAGRWLLHWTQVPALPGPELETKMYLKSPAHRPHRPAGAHPSQEAGAGLPATIPSSWEELTVLPPRPDSTADGESLDWKPAECPCPATSASLPAQALQESTGEPPSGLVCEQVQ